MEPLAEDEFQSVTPIITVQDVDTESDELPEDDDAQSLSPSSIPLQRATSNSSESSLVVVPLESRTSLGSVASERRTGALNRMGRDAAPFFSTLLLFAVLTSLLGCFTVGLGITIELQLGSSHVTWKTSLWWGGVVCFIVGFLYVLVHLTIRKEWPLGRFAFIAYQILLVVCVGLMIISIDFTFDTYQSVKGVETEQCTYINFQGTYQPLTRCYGPCRTQLFNTTGSGNPAHVCCCCYDNPLTPVVYITDVQDCTIVDSTEAKTRYLTVCHVVLLIFICVLLLTSALIQFGCCRIVPPWAYMKMRSSSTRYSIN